MVELPAEYGGPDNLRRVVLSGAPLANFLLSPNPTRIMGRRAQERLDAILGVLDSNPKTRNWAEITLLPLSQLSDGVLGGSTNNHYHYASLFYLGLELEGWRYDEVLGDEVRKIFAPALSTRSGIGQDQIHGVINGMVKGGARVGDIAIAHRPLSPEVVEFIESVRSIDFLGKPYFETEVVNLEEAKKYLRPDGKGLTLLLAHQFNQGVLERWKEGLPGDTKIRTLYVMDYPWESVDPNFPNPKKWTEFMHSFPTPQKAAITRALGHMQHRGLDTLDQLWRTPEKDFLIYGRQSAPFAKLALAPFLWD